MGLLDEAVSYSNTVAAYDRMCGWYRDFLKTKEAKSMIQRFDAKFPEFQVHESDKED